MSDNNWIRIKIIYGTIGGYEECEEIDYVNKRDNGNPHGYGPSITFIAETEDGKLWAMNDEYTSQINFCPFTGREAKTKINL
jgi:hypothetical protein